MHWVSMCLHLLLKCRHEILLSNSLQSLYVCIGHRGVGVGRTKIKVISGEVAMENAKDSSIPLQNMVLSFRKNDHGICLTFPAPIHTNSCLEEGW